MNSTRQIAKQKGLSITLHLSSTASVSLLTSLLALGLWRTGRDTFGTETGRTPELWTERRQQGSEPRPPAAQILPPTPTPTPITHTHLDYITSYLSICPSTYLWTEKQIYLSITISSAMSSSYSKENIIMKYIFYICICMHKYTIKKIHKLSFQCQENLIVSNKKFHIQ